MAIPSIDCEERVVPFTAGDGVALNLINVRKRGEKPTRDPVLLVHGAGVRGNIFRAPVQRNVVDALLDAGFDVWLENWRASIDVAPNAWTLDQAALFDHPAAVKAVIADTGASSIQAIIHCQGSTSFAMSAVAGLVPEVRTIVSNAVSLHPVVPWWSQQKLRFAVPVVSELTPYLSPAWGNKRRRAPGFLPKYFTTAVRAVHHECDNTVCKMVSFTYGSGFPALWRHENLNRETHDTFITGEFGHVPLSFFKQMSRCVSEGRMVRYEELSGLPTDFADGAPKTDARFSFFAGEHNLCFLPDSQKQSHAYLNALAPGKHTLHVLPGYSHLDVFLGKNASQDVFPRILNELN